MTSDNSAHVKKAPVIRFRDDTTLRWSMRDDDQVLWFSGTGAPSCPEDMTARALWNCREGDSVLLTNRVVDIPEWFELHPDDVCNAQCLAAEERLKGVFPWFAAQMTGQNIWRVPVGGRLAWIGEPREGPEGKDGVLAVLDCQSSMLVLGEPAKTGQTDAANFGKDRDTKVSPHELVDRYQLAFEAVYNLGVSRSMGMHWRLGDGQ